MFRRSENEWFVVGENVENTTFKVVTEVFDSDVHS